MKQGYRLIGMLMLALTMVVGCGGDAAYEEPAEAAATEAVETMAEAIPLDPAVAQMQADCAAAADAMAARQAESSLYDRLGGRDAIFAVTTDVVRRHRENPTIVHLMEGVDDERLIAQVTDFLSQGSGGDVEYHGMNMVDAHARFEMTDEYFLSAGGDVQAAMQAAGVGEEEIQEMMCMFASLRDEVVNK